MYKNSSQLSQPKYCSHIDGLRAVAVLAVVTFHAFPNWLRGGFIGVDIFFVISGYLISMIIFENLDKGRFSFSEFYARRIMRIFPALIFVLIVCFTFGWFSLLADEYQQLGKHMASGAGFVSNLILWSESGYFDNSVETKPLMHLWSLGIEEQFYIIWPLLLWIAWKQKFNLLTITASVAITSFALNLKGINQDLTATFFSPQTRFWELLSGSLLAWITIYKKATFLTIGKRFDELLFILIYREGNRRNGQTVANLLSWIGLFMIAYGFWRFNKDLGYPGKFALVPVVGTLFILMAGTNAWINHTLLSNKVAIWFGLISYPLYLWHWPLLSFARIVEGTLPNIKIRILILIASIVLAWFTYKLVECPLRFGKVSKARVVCLLLFMVFIGYLGFNAYQEGGLPHRKAMSGANAVRELAASYPHFPNHNEFCDNLHPDFKKFDVCIISKNIAPEVLLIGDSHANQYFKSLSSRLPKKSVMNLGDWSCLPFTSSTLRQKDGCEAKYLTAYKFVVESTSIKTVYLTGYWNYLASSGFGHEDDNYRLPQGLSESDATSFISNGRVMISGLLKSGKEIIFIKDIPDLDFNIRSCYSIRPYTLSSQKNREICGLERNVFNARTVSYNTVISEVLNGYTDLKIYDPIKLLCDELLCAASVNEKPLYWNSDHLTIRGADLVVDDLLLKFPLN